MAKSLLALRPTGNSFRPVVDIAKLAVAAPAALISNSPSEIKADTYDDLKSPLSQEIVEVDASSEVSESDISAAVTRFSVQELMAMKRKYPNPPGNFPHDIPCSLTSHKAEAKGQGKGKERGKSPGKKKEKAQVIALPQQSESAWKRTEVSGVEKLFRTLTSILNKLTVDNFDTLVVKFVDAVKADCDSFAVLKQVVHLVYEKALGEMSFGDLYPRLCEVLSRDLPSLDRESTENVDKVSFKKAMMEQCQSEFEKQIASIRELDEVLESLPEAESGIEEDNHVKQKLRMLGSMRFLGEMYLRGMLPTKVIVGCIAQFLQNTEQPGVTAMESLCALLTTCGKKLESESVKNKTNPANLWFSQLQTIANTSELPTRVKFGILDLIELRNSSWIPRRHVEKAQKIQDLHDGAGAAGIVADLRRVSAGVSLFAIFHKERSRKVRSSWTLSSGDRYSNVHKVKRVTDRPKYVEVKPMTETPKIVEEKKIVVEEKVDLKNSESYRLSSELMQSIKNLISEYLESKDLKEAVQSLQEIKLNKQVRNANLVYWSLCIGLAKITAPRDAVAKFLEELIQSKEVSSVDITAGLSLFLRDLVDYPTAQKMLVSMLEKLCKSAQVNLSVLKDALTFMEPIPPSTDLKNIISTAFKH